MSTKKNRNLLFFEGTYIWFYIYATKLSFITGRGTPQGGASVFLALFQTCNVLFVLCLMQIIYDFEFSLAVWISIVIFTCFVIGNTLLFEKKLDQIVKKHNAYTVKQRLLYKKAMWIYAILTVVSLSTVMLLME